MVRCVRLGGLTAAVPSLLSVWSFAHLTGDRARGLVVWNRARRVGDACSPSPTESSQIGTKSPKASNQSTTSAGADDGSEPQSGHVELVVVEGVERRTWTHWGGDQRGQVRDVVGTKSLR